MATDSSSDRDPVERLAEEYLERRRRGEVVTIDDYAEGYPDLAEQIRAVFPALEMMERLKPASGERTGSFDGGVSGDEQHPDRLGDYRIIREVGRGGMGVVYEALQESLGRHVALKVLPLAGRIDAIQMERFRLEARSAAKLHHTHIVPVHGVGEHGGVHYYAMQFIQGCGLDAVLDDLRRLRAEKSGAPIPAPGGMTERETSLSLAVARSLLGGESTAPGFTEVLGSSPSGSSSDGGAGLSGHSGPDYHRAVARIGVQIAEALAHAHGQGVLHRDIKPSNLLLDADGKAWVTDFGLAKVEGSDGPTRTGDVVGTLRYMAPERFDGWSDPRSDVYGLGMTLYELLTLRPAFEGVTRARLVERVMHATPAAPRKLDPRIPRDLETIVLKAIAKEPAERYATARALGEDLENFLAGKPIQARRVGLHERAWRWCRRNPMAAGLLAASGTAALAVIGVVIGFVINARLERDYSINQMVLAEREWHGNNAARAEQILDGIPTKYHGWEWHYLKRVCQSRYKEISGFTSPVFGVAFSPDSVHQEIASASQLDGVTVWDATTAKSRLRLDGLDGQVTAVAFSDDGRRLATGVWEFGQPSRIWIGSAEIGAEERKIPAHVGPIWCVAFNHDGTRLASAGEDGTVLVWDTKTFESIKTLKDETQGFTSVTFSRDGRYIAAATGTRYEHALENRPGQVRIWDTSTWKEVQTPKKHSGSVNSIAFSSDGRRLASASSDRTVKIWDTETGEEVSTLRGHTQFVVGVAFSPDGKQLVSASEDTTLRVWDTETEENLLILHGHKGMVNCVAYSPDGKRIASGGDDMTVKIWNTEQPPVARILGGAGRKWFTSVAFSPDHERLAAANGDRTVTIWDRASYRVLTILPEHRLPIWGVAFNRESLIASACGAFNRAEQPSEVNVWDYKSSQLVSSLPMRLKVTWSVAFSPDGHLIATGGGDPVNGPAELKVWDAITGKVHREFTVNTKGVVSVTFSPDGQSLASASNDGSVNVWDVKSGTLTRSIVGPKSLWSVAFSPDRKSLAMGGFGSVTIWSLATGRRLQDLLGHMTQVRKAVFHPNFNGQRLASAGDDGTVRIWDVETGQEVLTLREHRGPVLDVAFSPDGRQLVSASRDGTVRVWDGTPWVGPNNPSVP